MTFRNLLALLALTVLVACQSQSGTQEPERAATPPEANRMRPGHWPTAFSADEIRAASPNGAMRELLFREGERTVHVVMEFVDVDAEGAGVDVTVLADSDPQGADQSQFTTFPRMSWTEMQAESSLPLRATTLTRADVETDAGLFDCWVYTTEDLLTHSEWTFSYALALPGMPVLAVVKNADGVETLRTTLLAYR